MSLSKLPSNRWRAQVWDVRQGKSVSVATVLGTPGHTWPTKREAKAAREEARKRLGTMVAQQETVAGFAKRWLTDPIFQTPKESTRKQREAMSRAFIDRYGTVPLRLVGDEIVSEWLAGGNRNSTIPVLRKMFNDAGSPKAGRLVDRNPFAGLGLEQGRGNAEVDPPSPETVEAIVAAGHRMAGPFYGAWLAVACATGMRPGELDALRWEHVDFDRERIHVVAQFNYKSMGFTLPKNGKKRWAILTPDARLALLELPKHPSGFCFVNSQGRHWTAWSREHHWDKVQAAVGLPAEHTLYVSTRHYAGWYMTNRLGLEAEVVAIALGHEDGGYLVRRTYGHREKDQALAQVLRAYKGAGVVPLRAVKEDA
jgi:integrase